VQPALASLSAPAEEITSSRHIEHWTTGAYVQEESHLFPTCRFVGEQGREQGRRACMLGVKDKN
jgi:hypothetical protein